MDRKSHALLLEHIQYDFMYNDRVGDKYLDNIYHTQLNSSIPFVHVNPGLGKLPKKKSNVKYPKKIMYKLYIIFYDLIVISSSSLLLSL